MRDGLDQCAYDQRKGRKQHFVEASPASLVGTVTVLAVVAGIVGAKIFHIMENWGDFMADPRGMLFSQGGLTFMVDCYLPR